MGCERWQLMKLGDFVTLQRGHDLPEPQRKLGTIPILGSFGITGYHNKAKAKGPGITIGRSGGSFGVVSYSPVDYWPLNTALYVTDFHGNDERFAYYFLKSFDFSGYNSGSAQPSLNRNYIHPIPIKIPPLQEQRAIAYILGTLDDKIELNRQLNETLEAMVKAIFKSWFVDFDPVRAKMEGSTPCGIDDETAALFPSSFENSELGEIPNGWRVGKLKECCERVENGGTPRRDVPNYWEPGTIPWLTSGEVRQGIVTFTNNHISEEGLIHSSAKMWPKETTVVALYGATAGQSCFLAKEMCANQACCGLIPTDSMRYYLYLYVSSSVEAFERQTRGSAQQNLSQQIVADFPTLIADITILNIFNNIVSPLFSIWINNLQEISTIATIRNTLLPKLLSGEIRVKDAERYAEALL